MTRQAQARPARLSGGRCCGCSDGDLTLFRQDTTDLVALFQGFISDEVAGGMASGDTARTYKRETQQFWTWCREQWIDPLTATRDDVVTYRRWLIERYAPASVALKLSAVRPHALFWLPPAHTRFLPDPSCGSTAGGATMPATRSWRSARRRRWVPLFALPHSLDDRTLGWRPAGPRHDPPAPAGSAGTALRGAMSMSSLRGPGGVPVTCRPRGRGASGPLTSRPHALCPPRQRRRHGRGSSLRGRRRRRRAWRGGP